MFGKYFDKALMKRAAGFMKSLPMDSILGGLFPEALKKAKDLTTFAGAPVMATLAVNPEGTGFVAKLYRQEPTGYAELRSWSLDSPAQFTELIKNFIPTDTDTDGPAFPDPAESTELQQPGLPAGTGYAGPTEPGASFAAPALPNGGTGDDQAV